MANHYGRCPSGAFVSGTGTDVGKTVVTAALLRALAIRGFPAQAVKVIQTGIDPVAPICADDTSVYDDAVKDISAAALTHCMHRFSLPSSPHLAAARENARLNAEDLKEEIFRHWLGRLPYITLLEGSGGLFVPLNERETILDLMRLLGMPVILVCGNIVGALNHFYLSMEALLNRGLEIAAVALTDMTREPYQSLSAQTAKEIMDDNEWMIRSHLETRYPRAIFARMPFYPHFSPAAWQDAAMRVAAITDSLITHCDKTKIAEKSDSLVARDRRILWHPYARAVSNAPLEEVRDTYANRIILKDGRELVDGMSSWWACAHGYKNPRITHAMREQILAMPHIMFGGLTHAPAVELAERLLEVLPQNLKRIFFADSGSVAVEVAMKMALQYQIGIGSPERTLFLTPRGGYHGDTFGAMSVCDPVNGMHTLFAGSLARQVFMERPACRFDAPYDDHCLDGAREIFARQGSQIAAVIIEPIVQGAGGMWFYHPQYLKGLADLCAKYGALLILDEIATGFGRTGKYFACEWSRVHPDIITLGKALTGGHLTLAATACSGDVAAGIDASGAPLMHGPTFMANALACSAACAALEIMSQNRWQKEVATLEEILKKTMLPCKRLPGVADARVLGGIGVVEMKSNVNTSALHDYFSNSGVWIRPFNKLIYLMPPYISPEEDVERLGNAVFDAINQEIWR